MRFREELWSHRPVTDFWRVGRGYAKKLEAYGMFTSGDVDRCTVNNEDLLYKLFGKNAVLRGMDMEEGTTAKARNTQMGGHRA